MKKAVVFAYHDVGVRCLSVLLAAGLDIALVVTHEDDPDENIWFDSVAELARLNGIPVITPDTAKAPALLERVRDIAPDFIFSFYYRYMIGAELLGCAREAALNMHGSLLPHYRGRVPINWAIIHGETETGASLHHMEVKPDAGALVDQQAVPILPDDTALDVFHKVTWAAEVVLHRSLPGLLSGTAKAAPLDLAAGSYFGRRRPEDGRIMWDWPARQVHDLIRAVAPPYPGAFSDAGGHKLEFLGSHWVDEPAAHTGQAPCLYAQADRLYADCGDDRRIRITRLVVDGVEVDADAFRSRVGTEILSLGD